MQRHMHRLGRCNGRSERRTEDNAKHPCSMLGRCTELPKVTYRAQMCTGALRGRAVHTVRVPSRLHAYLGTLHKRRHVLSSQSRIAVPDCKRSARASSLLRALAQSKVVQFRGVGWFCAVTRLLLPFPNRRCPVGWTEAPVSGSGNRTAKTAKFCSPPIASCKPLTTASSGSSNPPPRSTAHGWIARDRRRAAGVLWLQKPGSCIGSRSPARRLGVNPSLISATSSTLATPPHRSLLPLKTLSPDFLSESAPGRGVESPKCNPSFVKHAGGAPLSWEPGEKETKQNKGAKRPRSSQDASKPDVPDSHERSRKGKTVHVRSRQTSDWLFLALAGIGETLLSILGQPRAHLLLLADSVDRETGAGGVGCR